MNCSHGVVANVFEGGSADLTWACSKNVTECGQWMSLKSQEVSSCYPQLFGNSTRKTWGELLKSPPPRIGFRDSLLSTSWHILVCWNMVGIWPYLLVVWGDGCGSDNHQKAYEDYQEGRLPRHAGDSEPWAQLVYQTEATKYHATPLFYTARLLPVTNVPRHVAYVSILTVSHIVGCTYQNGDAGIFKDVASADTAQAYPYRVYPAAVWHSFVQ